MMEKVSLPNDFDWVGARKSCSADKVFESLHLGARKNVESMTMTQDGRTWNNFVFMPFDGSFSVIRQDSFDRAGVRFYVEQQSRIVAESHGLRQPVSMKADLTVNDNGECRLSVDGVELQEWQFLRRALEPLFFYRRDF